MVFAVILSSNGLCGMSAPQLTFWITNGAVSVALLIAFYPGVRRHARSRRDSLLASLMAATLCGTAGALILSFFVNAILKVSQSF